MRKISKSNKSKEVDPSQVSIDHLVTTCTKVDLNLTRKIGLLVQWMINNRSN